MEAARRARGGVVTDQEREYHVAMALRQWWATVQLRKGRWAVLSPAQLAHVYGIRGDQRVSVFDV